MEESRKMAKIACAALADKKGEDIKVIDISNVSVCRLFYYRKRNQMTAKYMLW